MAQKKQYEKADLTYLYLGNADILNLSDPFTDDVYSDDVWFS